MDSEKDYMARALELARQGEGMVSPNPLVGALIVLDGLVIGEGFHRFEGVRHAESYALEMAGAAARGATLYCNLEPCCHHGRTPPCTGTLIESGIARVVVATADPDPRVNEAGLGQLRAAGIEVKVGLLAAEAARLNEIYFKYRSTGRPFLHLISGLAPSGGTSSMSREATAPGRRAELKQLTDETPRTQELRGGGIAAHLGQVPPGWQPSIDLLRLAHRYDALVLGDSESANRLIASAYLMEPHHRIPIVAGTEGCLDDVRAKLAPRGRPGASFISLDDPGAREPGRAGRARDDRERRGRGGAIALDGLLNVLDHKQVTSVLVVEGPIRIEAELDGIDKVTLVVDRTDFSGALESVDWAGYGVIGLVDTQSQESGGFIELTGSPIRK